MAVIFKTSTRFPRQFRPALHLLPSLNFGRCPSNPSFLYIVSSTLVPTSCEPAAISRPSYLFQSLYLSAFERPSHSFFYRCCIDQKCIPSLLDIDLREIHNSIKHRFHCMRSIRNYTMGCFDRLSNLKRHFARLRPGRSRRRELNIVRPNQRLGFQRT